MNLLLTFYVTITVLVYLMLVSLIFRSILNLIKNSLYLNVTSEGISI